MAERIERQPAFVLHERAYRETSALLELFTRDLGRVAVVARGLRAAKPRIPRGSLRAGQPIECGLLLRGELGQLIAAEPVGLPRLLTGVHLQSALYLNELLARLLERHDPHPILFDAYANLLGSMPDDRDALGFALRRFESLLLGEIGYGIDFGIDASSGEAVVAEARYRVIAEHGVVAAPPLDLDAVPGAALLGLQSGRQPDAEALRPLRRMMRSLLLHHLGGRGLNAWRVLRAPASPADPS